MMEKSGRLKSFFWGIISNGLTYDSDLETLRKIILLNIIMILGWIFLSLLGFMAFFQHNKILGTMDAVMLVFVIGLFYYLKTSMNIGVVSKIGITIIGIFYFFLFVIGGVHQSAFVWLYTYPLIAIFLLGNKWGSIATFALLFASILFFAFGDRISSFPMYKTDLMLRFVPSYISTHLFTYVMEKSRSIIQFRLKEANQKQLILIEKLKSASDDLKEMAIKDELTGLYNRRYFNEIFSLVCKRSRRFRDVVAALMIDIDYFKKYNDHYGHLAGDDILKQVAQVFSSSIRRETDFAFRYGGEEFIIILSKTNKITSEQIAMKIIENLSKTKIEHIESPTGFLTVSIGIAFTDTNINITENTLVKHADLALYEAKQKGRNRYMIAAEPS